VAVSLDVVRPSVSTFRLGCRGAYCSELRHPAYGSRDATRGSPGHSAFDGSDQMSAKS
jgi:hypothetical protein